MLFGPKVYDVVKVAVKKTPAGIQPEYGWYNHCKNPVYATANGRAYTGPYVGVLVDTCPTCGVKIRWKVPKR